MARIQNLAGTSTVCSHEPARRCPRLCRTGGGQQLLVFARSLAPQVAGPERHPEGAYRSGTGRPQHGRRGRAGVERPEHPARRRPVSAGKNPGRRLAGRNHLRRGPHERPGPVGTGQGASPGFPPAHRGAAGFQRRHARHRRLCREQDRLGSPDAAADAGQPARGEGAVRNRRRRPAGRSGRAAADSDARATAGGLAAPAGAA